VGFVDYPWSSVNDDEGWQRRVAELEAEVERLTLEGGRLRAALGWIAHRASPEMAARYGDQTLRSVEAEARAALGQTGGER
jgi:hypothetical protein